MAAARQRIPLTILDDFGVPRVGVSATVKRRSTGAAVSVYSTELGGGTLANPGAITSAADGTFPGWVERDSLVATVSGGGLPAPKDLEFESNPGRRTAPYYAHALGTSTLISAANTFQDLNMQTEVVDADGVFTPGVGGTARYIAPETGLYLVEATIQGSSLVSGATRDYAIFTGATGGTIIVFSRAIDASDATVQTPSYPVYWMGRVPAGEFIYPRARVSSGVGTTSFTVQRFAVTFLGALA